MAIWPIKLNKKKKLPFEIIKGVEPYKVKVIKSKWTSEELEKEMSSESMRMANEVVNKLIILEDPEEIRKYREANNL